MSAIRILELPPVCDEALLAMEEEGGAMAEERKEIKRNMQKWIEKDSVG